MQPKQAVSLSPRRLPFMNSDAGNAQCGDETQFGGGEPASEAPSAAPKDHGDSETHNGDVPALRPQKGYSYDGCR
jgi:hypothetical protein